MPEEINTNDINSNEINEQILLNQDEKITETNQLLGATMQQNEERKQLSEAGLMAQEAIKEKMNGKPSIYVSTIIDAFLESLGEKLKGKDGQKGDKGDMPKKGVDYFTPEDINDIQEYVQSQVKDGEDGYTPIKGIDYFTPDEINSIVSQVRNLIPTPKDGKDAEVDYNAIINEVLSKIKIPKGKDGKDGRSISGKEVAQKLEKLEGEDRLSFNSLKDAPQFKGGGGANYVRELNDVEETSDSYKFSNVEIEKTGSINLIEGQKYKINDVPLSASDITNAESIENKETEELDNSETKYPCNKVVKDYADSLVMGLLDYRGGYDASSNTYPTSGGSGTDGAVMKGDMWIINVAGTLGGLLLISITKSLVS
ncbi:MAG: hypothetical protein PHX17_02735 [Candidatus Pacebacteria bacterium]|nr:hypothetical protein [Candidatus Paceibacterota bacterium]